MFSKRTVVLAVAVAFLLGFGWTAMVQARADKVVTLSFYHDGLYTDGYVVTVDGITVPFTATCVGTGDTRLCSGSITLTTGVQHSIVVQATNVLGTNDSAPFPAGPPRGKPVVVGVK